MELFQKLLFGIFVSGFTWKLGNALVCMNCTSASLVPTPGCHEDFSDEFLIECEEQATRCKVTRYEGSFGGQALIQYQRSCANKQVEECSLVNTEDYDGVTCVYTCEGDGCNGMNVFPNEPEFTTTLAPPTESMTYPGLETTPEPAYGQGVETTFAPDSTPESDSTPVTNTEPEPELEYSTPEPKPEGHGSTPEAEPEIREWTPEPESSKQTGLLRCYNCTSNSFDPTDGCNVKEFYDENLIECKSEDKYCLVTRFSSDVHGASFIEYERSCSPVPIDDECEDVDYDYYTSTRCVYTCKTDGCNTLEIFPGEEGYSPPTTTQSSTLEETTSAATEIQLNILLFLFTIIMMF